MAVIVVGMYRVPDQVNALKTYIETLDDTKWLDKVVITDSSGKGVVMILTKT